MLALGVDPRRVRSPQLAACRGAGDDRGQRDDERVAGLGVPDERGANERAGEHDGDRDQPTAGQGKAEEHDVHLHAQVTPIAGRYGRGLDRAGQWPQTVGGGTAWGHDMPPAGSGS